MVETRQPGYILAHDLGTTGNKARCAPSTGILSPPVSGHMEPNTCDPTGPSKTRPIGCRPCVLRRKTCWPKLKLRPATLP
jgi:hypothetical protein